MCITVKYDNYYCKSKIVTFADRIDQIKITSVNFTANKKEML